MRCIITVCLGMLLAACAGHAVDISSPLDSHLGVGGSSFRIKDLSHSPADLTVRVEECKAIIRLNQDYEGEDLLLEVYYPADAISIESAITHREPAQPHLELVQTGADRINAGFAALNQGRLHFKAGDLLTINYRVGAQRTVSSYTLSSKAAARVYDPEVIYNHSLSTTEAQFTGWGITWSKNLPGDTDFNNLVTMADLTPLGRHYGQTTFYNMSFAEGQSSLLDQMSFSSELAQIDANRDGEVNVADLSVLGRTLNMSLKNWDVMYDSVSRPPVPLLPQQALESPHGKGKRFQYYRTLPQTSDMNGDVWLVSNFQGSVSDPVEPVDGLKRHINYSFDTSAVSQGSVPTGMIPGALADVITPSNSYCVLAAKGTSTVSGAIYDYSRSGHTIESTPQTFNLTGGGEVIDIKPGNFGGNRNLAVLRKVGTAYSVVLLQVTSNGVQSEISESVPFTPSAMNVNNLDLVSSEDELVIWPADRTYPSQGFYLSFNSTDYDTSLFYCGDAISAAMVDKLDFSGQSDLVLAVANSDVVLYGQNFQGTGLTGAVLPFSGLIAGFGNQSDLFPGFAGRQKTMISHARLPASDTDLNSDDVLFGFDTLPMLLLYDCNSSSLTFATKGAQLELYRNLYGDTGTKVTSKPSAIVACHLNGGYDTPSDIAYLMQDAIAWRYGQGQVAYWADNALRAQMVTGETSLTYTDEPTTFSEIYQLTGVSGSPLVPHSIAAADLDSLYSTPYDELVISTGIGSTEKLVCVHF